jgi:hypothetical protein
MNTIGWYVLAIQFPRLIVRCVGILVATINQLEISLQQNKFK